MERRLLADAVSIRGRAGDFRRFVNGSYAIRAYHVAKREGTTAMAEPVLSESRHRRRQRVLKGGAILTGVAQSEIKCEIRNMSKSGAELKVAIDSPVPQEFLLYVPVDGVAYRATVRWRKQDRIGVEFTGAEPKPHWHYG